MQMVGGNGGNQFRQYAGQNIENQVAQNPRVQNDGNQNQIGMAKEKECCLSSDTVIDCSKGRGSNLTSSKRQASSLGTQTDSTPVYDSNGSVEGT
nr:hypothetical protein [Tanacetum cinerariifolium]